MLNALRTHPADTHLVIAVVDAQYVKTETDTGERTPTVRIRQIEVITGDDGHAAMGMLDRANARRTGQDTLISSADAGSDDGRGGAWAPQHP